MMARDLPADIGIAILFQLFAIPLSVKHSLKEYKSTSGILKSIWINIKESKELIGKYDILKS
jgi:hypothetical protein